jgi:hypothetical protein
MNRTAHKKAFALVVLVTSTLLSYAKLVGVVLAERLWRIPQRQLRTAEHFANTASRRMPWTS